MFGLLGKKEDKKQRREMDSLAINQFDERAYLEANPTVQNISTNTKIYLEKYGWSSIAAGKHKFHKDFDFFIEERYLENYNDVAEGVSRGEFASGYDHFRLFGYDEIIRGFRDYDRTISSPLVPAVENKSSIAEKTEIPDEKLEENMDIEDKSAEDQKSRPEEDMPESAIDGFSLEDYLNISLDDHDEIRLANLYLNQIGYNNIILGKSKFHKDYEVFEQEKYYRYCPDIDEVVKSGLLVSGEDHFIHYGYKEIIEGRRYWPKEENNRNLEKLRFINYRRKNRKGNNEH